MRAVLERGKLVAQAQAQQPVNSEICGFLAGYAHADPHVKELMTVTAKQEAGNAQLRDFERYVARAKREYMEKVTGRQTAEDEHLSGRATKVRRVEVLNADSVHASASNGRPAEAATKYRAQINEMRVSPRKPCDFNARVYGDSKEDRSADGLPLAVSGPLRVPNASEILRTVGKPRFIIACEALAATADRRMPVLKCVPNILSTIARCDQNVRKLLQNVSHELATAEEIQRFDSYLEDAAKQHPLIDQPEAHEPSQLDRHEITPSASRSSQFQGHTSWVSPRIVAGIALAQSSRWRSFCHEPLSDNLIACSVRNPVLEGAIKAMADGCATPGQEALFDSAVDTIVKGAAEPSRAAVAPGSVTIDPYGLIRKALEQRGGFSSSTSHVANALAVRFELMPSLGECARRVADGLAGEGERNTVQRAVDETTKDVEACQRALLDWQRSSSYFHLSSKPDWVMQEDWAEATNYKMQLWFDVSRQALSRKHHSRAEHAASPIVEMLAWRALRDSAFRNVAVTISEGRSYTAEQSRWAVAVDYAERAVARGEFHIKAEDAQHLYGPRLLLPLLPRVTSSEPGQPLSRIAPAQRVVLQLSMKHPKDKNFDHVVSGLVEGATSSGYVETQIRAVARGDPTEAQLDILNVWVDTLLAPGSNAKQIQPPRAPVGSSLLHPREPLEQCTAAQSAVVLPRSREQTLASKAWLLAETGRCDAGEDEAIITLLAQQAQQDAVLKYDLRQVSLRSTNVASIRSVRSKIEECLTARSAAQLGSTPAVTPAAETTGFQGVVQTDATQDDGLDDVGDDGIKVMQVQAMKARIELQHPNLCTSEPLVRKLASYAQHNASFEECLAHVAGANGNLAIDKEHSKAFRRVANDLEAKLEAEATPDQVWHQKHPKLSAESWPLRHSMGYTRLLKPEARLGRREAKDAWTRKTKPITEYQSHQYCFGTRAWSRTGDVQYPLTLLPEKTRQSLRDNKPAGAVCSFCQRPCTPSPHQRKLFLVAERLAWPAGSFFKDRTRNEEALWAVNFQLSIEEPVNVNGRDTTMMFGGNANSQNALLPFTTESQAEFVMTMVEKAEGLSEESWKMWKKLLRCDTQAENAPAAQQEKRNDDDDIIFMGSRPAMKSMSGNVRRSPRKYCGLPTPPPSAKSSGQTGQRKSSAGMSLKDFYKSLDKIERTSPMAVRFLEAYAEKLHAEVCKTCWLEQTIGASEEHNGGESEHDIRNEME